MGAGGLGACGGPKTPRGLEVTTAGVLAAGPVSPSSQTGNR